MPKQYKSFLIPTGQDPADLPHIFEDFITSGIKDGAVIAHFGTVADANSQIANFPDGSMVWIGAVLFRSNGSTFQPVLSSGMGSYAKFATTTARDIFYSAPPTGSGLPVAGQLAMVGSSAGGATGTYLTMWDGVAWQNSSDPQLRNRQIVGTHGPGGTLSIGDPANPHRYPAGSVGYRKADGWAINLAGHTFVDGNFSLSNGSLTTVTGSHVITGSALAINAPITTNMVFNGYVHAKNYVEGLGGLFGPTLNVNAIGPRDQSNTSPVQHYGVTTFNNGVWMTENLVIRTGLTVQSNGCDFTGTCKFHGATETEGLRTYGGAFIGGDLVYTGAFGQWSDRRMKTDIVDAPRGALDIVDSTPVRSFSMLGTKSEFGWIAQEVQEKLPSAITETENVLADEEFGDQRLTAVDGSNIDTVLGIDMSEMTSVLWKAVQELSAEVKDLKAQVAALSSGPELLA